MVGNDARQLQMMERRFDVISAIQVLEHITDPSRISGLLRELLKPDGVMVVIIPHFTYLNAAVSKAASPNVTAPFHVSLFSEDNLRVILGRVGVFEHLQISQYGPPAFSLIHHYDVSEYWDILIPTAEEPMPRGYMVKEYPLEISTALNALEQADQAMTEYFSEVDGRLYVMAICPQTMRRRGATS